MEYLLLQARRENIVFHCKRVVGPEALLALPEEPAANLTIGAAGHPRTGGERLREA